MEAKQCQCGAVTVTGDGFNNSMTLKTFRVESNGQYFVFHPDVRKFVSDLIKSSNQS